MNNLKPIFQEYYIKNLIDLLLDKFKNAKFQLNEISNNKEFHKYSWPNIILSDEITLTNNSDETEKWNIDKLGKYNNKRREITLYIQKIINVSTAYQLTDINLNLNKVITEITTIVLLHEITHWIVTSVEVENSNLYNKHKYRSYQQKCFHEGLAQFFTFKSLQSELLSIDVNIFHWLNINSPTQYSIYAQLKDNEISTIIRMLIVARKKDIQEWDKFKELATLSRGTIKTGIYGI